jgi:catechol 2,3-dioxygenase-like lactoylglutathione lyase family enzyme
MSAGTFAPARWPFVLLMIAFIAILNSRTTFSQASVELRIATLKMNVDDMDKALSFYCDKLGFEIADKQKYPQEVSLKTNDNFKLILNRVKKLRKFNPTETQVGLTLQVNNLDQAIERMKSLNVNFGEAQPRKEGVGNAIYILDPFGRRISLMHQTIVAVEPFKEPRIYNFGLLIPDMIRARDFYADKLGFVVRSEKYLPLDLPLGYPDKTFAFMLHYRPGTTAIVKRNDQASPFITIVFATSNLSQTVEAIKRNGIAIVNVTREVIRFVDPFGNVSELVEGK